MNSVERTGTALLLGQPDRVPIVEFLIDPSVYRAILPDTRDQSDFRTGWTWTLSPAPLTGSA